MPFPWQTSGALQGGVPNQINAFTPQNNEGLGVPWGKAMFNLPRYQTPGSEVNFNGGFGAPGVAPVGGVNFSITRQASSDPVEALIKDIQNPLGGMTANFSPAAPAVAPSPLKQRMTDTGIGQPGGGMPSPSGMDLLAGQAPAMSAMHLAGADTPAYAWSDPTTPMRPFVLRNKMMQQAGPALGPVFA